MSKQELPFDVPDDLRVRFDSHDYHIVPIEPDDYCRKVEGHILAWKEDSDDDIEVGVIELWDVRLNLAIDNGESVFDVLDACCEETAEFLELFDGDEWTEQILAALDHPYTNDFLIIEAVEIDEKYRGHGIGLVAAMHAIDIYSNGGVVAIVPFPFQFAGKLDPTKVPPDELAALRAEFDQAQAKLRAYWSRLGFCRMGESRIFALNAASRLPAMEELLNRRPAQVPEPEPPHSQPPTRELAASRRRCVRRGNRHSRSAAQKG